jgi:succinyl-CoA synthetase beta subunit
MLVSTYSCKDDNVVNQEKKERKENKSANQEKVDYVAQEIGYLYNPEKMTIKENKVGINNEKENYQITLTNSDLLDNDIENVEKHAKKIATVYYKFLFQNIKPFNLKKIIIKIEHRNTKINSFEYSEENINQLLDLK